MLLYMVESRFRHQIQEPLDLFQDLSIRFAIARVIFGHGSPAESALPQ